MALAARRLSSEERALHSSREAPASITPAFSPEMRCGPCKEWDSEAGGSSAKGTATAEAIRRAARTAVERKSFVMT
jgi:hypothetical protein